MASTVPLSNTAPAPARTSRRVSIMLPPWTRRQPRDVRPALSRGFSLSNGFRARGPCRDVAGSFRRVNGRQGPKCGRPGKRISTGENAGRVDGVQELAGAGLRLADIVDRHVGA